MKFPVSVSNTAPHSRSTPAAVANGSGLSPGAAFKLGQHSPFAARSQPQLDASSNRTGAAIVPARVFLRGQQNLYVLIQTRVFERIETLAPLHTVTARIGVSIAVKRE